VVASIPVVVGITLLAVLQLSEMYDPVVGPECYLRPVAVILSSHTLRHYGERAGNIYNRSDVEVIESEGRSFISWMCPQRVE